MVGRSQFGVSFVLDVSLSFDIRGDPGPGLTAIAAFGFLKIVLVGFFLVGSHQIFTESCLLLQSLYSKSQYKLLLRIYINSHLRDLTIFMHD